MTTSMLTVREAAERIGISYRGVLKLIERGTLPASKFGKNLVLDPAVVARVKVNRPKRGRPAMDVTLSDE